MLSLFQEAQTLAQKLRRQLLWIVLAAALAFVWLAVAA
jgi:hypothetical protein